MRLRRYPALLLLYGGGVAAVASGNYGNLRALLRQARVRSYGSTGAASLGLVPDRVIYRDDQKHLQERRYRMPFSQHLVSMLRKPLENFVHGDEHYMECFVRFEYLYALAREAQGNGLIVGSFAWESKQQKGLERYPRTRVWIVSDTEAELDRVGADWPPLKGGLFDGPVELFRAFKNETDQKVLQAAGNFFRH